MTIRLAMLLPSLRGGGLERIARDLVLALPEHGIVPAVFTVGGLGIYARDLGRAGIQVTDCSEGRLRIWGINVKLIRALRAFGPDVVHAHSGTWYAAAVAKKFLERTRLVFTDHGRYPPEPAGRALIERWCWHRTDRMLVVSAALGDYVVRFLGIPRSPEVMPNGIDLSLYQRDFGSEELRTREQWGCTPENIVIGAIGRLVPIKHHDGLIRAFAQVAVANPKLRLVLIGSGPLERSLRELARMLNISSRVHFAGYREDIPSCLAGLDIFALPSLTEGHPMSLLEAMAAGLPSVASATGGIPDILANGQAGLLVPAGDTAALAMALSRLCEDSALRKSLSVAAAERVRLYNFRTFVERHVRLYSGLLHVKAA